MTDTIIARRTWEKALPNGHPLTGGSRSKHLLRADAKLYSLGGQAPHFSLTGDLLNTRRTSDPFIMGGCMHEELTAEWPELAPLAAIHLSDDHGVPIHAIGNGLYWLGLNTNLTIFAGLWRVSEEEAQQAYDYCKAHTDLPDPTEAIKVLYFAMLPKWQEEAIKALVILRGGS